MKVVSINTYLTLNGWNLSTNDAGEEVWEHPMPCLLPGPVKEVERRQLRRDALCLLYLLNNLEKAKNDLDKSEESLKKSLGLRIMELVLDEVLDFVSAPDTAILIEGFWGKLIETDPEVKSGFSGFRSWLTGQVGKELSKKLLTIAERMMNTLTPNYMGGVMQLLAAAINEEKPSAADGR